MAGISGILSLDGRDPGLRLAKGMNAAMTHRGPDGLAEWTDGIAALGHCKLATTPEAVSETQPVVFDDGASAMVMDGRVDNRESLLASIGNLSAKAAPDADLVVLAYRKWGPRLRGAYRRGFRPGDLGWS